MVKFGPLVFYLFDLRFLFIGSFGYGRWTLSLLGPNFSVLQILLYFDNNPKMHFYYFHLAQTPA